MKAHLTGTPPAPGEEFHDVEDAETYKKMLARDERRFRVADQDGDSMATREELTAFLHPEEFPHMRDIVIAVSGGLGNPLPASHLPPGTQASDARPGLPSLTLWDPVTWSSASSPGNPGHKRRSVEGDIYVHPPPRRV